MAGTVTGLTAERMIEIEASSVTTGDVDENGNLILETRGGIPIDAGNVVGLKPVHHGTVGTVARPDVALVYWIGTATPVNANDWDFQLRENI